MASMKTVRPWSMDDRKTMILSYLVPGAWYRYRYWEWELLRLDQSHSSARRVDSVKKDRRTSLIVTRNTQRALLILHPFGRHKIPRTLPYLFNEHVLSMTLVVLRRLLRRVPALRTASQQDHVNAMINVSIMDSMMMNGIPTSLQCRALSMKRRLFPSEMAPGHKLDSVQYPPDFTTVQKPLTLDPMAHVRRPVTSAHMIVDNVVSARDSVSVAPSGSIVHGRYGDLGVQDGIPLEYLALLRPAAEAAAATSKLGHSGTLLVFGATQAAGLAAVQLWKGAAVCAVVGGEHSGVDEMLGIVKGLTKEPGFVVAEEFALYKKNFADLVHATVHGETMERADPDRYLADFKEILLENAEEYPDTRPAAVAPEDVEFGDRKQSDFELFRDNLDPYLAQFPAGSPPLDPAKVDAYFTLEQYQIFKKKFMRK